MTTKLAEVDLRSGEYLVQSYSRSEAGYWVSWEVPARLPSSVSPGVLGDAVMEALDLSGEGAKTPGRDEYPARAMLDALGLRSYAAYMKGTSSVEVEATTNGEGRSITVTRQRNEGARDGFVAIDDHAIAFAYDSPGQVGKAIIDAFQNAT